MKVLKSFMVQLVLVGMTGCFNLPSVGPDYEGVDVVIPVSELPDAGKPLAALNEIGEYKLASADEDTRTVLTTNEIVNWWTKFNDDALTNLISSAVSSNISFMIAQKRLDAARWQLLGSYAAFMPKVAGVGSASRFQKGPNTQSGWGTGKTIHRDLFTGGFDATWEIDIFGGNRRNTESAWAEAEAAGWTVADAYVTLTAEVASRYISLRTSQQLIAVARTNLVLQSETYDILKSRLDSGIGDELAVNQSKYIVDETRSRIPELIAAEEKLLNAMAILTGEMPGSRHEELRSCPQRNWLIEPMKLSETPIDMIRNRPDVRVAERKLAAQVARVGVAKSLWYPKLFINGSLGLESIHIDKFLRRDAFYGSIGPSVSWPIFQGGNIYASVKTEEAKMEEAYLSYELALQEAYREVRDTYAAYTQEYHRYQALQGAVKAAQDAVAISKDLYRNGLRDFTAVIDAQRSLLTLQEQLVVSRNQITLDIIALFKALGGGLQF